MTDSNAAPGGLPSGITREVLERDGLRETLRRRHPDLPMISNAGMRASIRDTLAARPPLAGAADGVWLFGYGSLLWNPCVAVAEWRDARLYGYHRDFRIRLTHGRGCPDAPGLMLGLVRGGSCPGMALRVAVDDLDHELLMIWRREMLTGVYTPRWVRLRTDAGPVAAIAFVVNRAHENYCGRLDETEVVQLLATGHGEIGSAADYLDSTVARLDAQGIHDRRLRHLRARVAAQRARMGASSG